MAWTITLSVRSAIAISRLEVSCVRGRRQRLGFFDGCVELLEVLLRRVRFCRVIPETVSFKVHAQPPQWVFASPGLDFRGGLVTPRIVRGRVCADPIGEGLHEHRSLASSGVFERPEASGINSQGI